MRFAVTRSLVILGLGLLALAGLSSPSLAEKLKIAFVYFSPVEDTGWTFEHDKGRKAMEAALGDKVEAKIVENVPYGPDAERVIRQLAEEGYKLIYTTSFGFMDQTLAVAEEFPDVKFMHLDGFKSRENMATYSLRYYEPSYLAGMVAGSMTKSNTIGYVSAFPVPAVLQIINGFALGARSVNPNVTVKVIEVNSWADPGREREATEALYAQGADIVAQVTDTSAPTQAAEKAGKWVIGFHSDRTKHGPTSQLTAIIPIWGDFYTKMAQTVLDGKWTNAPVWSPMSEGVLGLAPLGAAVPKDVADKVMAKMEEIKAGTFNPFTGPIKDQSGKVRAEAGQVMPDADIAGMNWYVEGVDGKLPQ